MKILNSTPNLAVFMRAFLPMALIQNEAVGQKFPTEIPKENIVVNGRVSSKKGTWSSDGTTIYTVNWLKPKAVFQGAAQADSIPVITPGGITDEGLLVVTHALEFQPSNNYLLALEPCSDCVDGLTAYIPVGAIPDFNREAYLREISKWRDKPRMAGDSYPCDTGESELQITFSNVHISLSGQAVNGYIDLKTKTEQAPKMLQSISSKLNYADAVFGTYAISSQNVTISPIGTDMVAAYTTSSNDLSSNNASFSVTKNPSATEGVIINDYYQSSIRLSFVTDAASLQNLPSELSGLFGLEELSASYLCEGREYQFDRIIIDEKSIGVVLEGLTSSISYFIEGVEYIPSSSSYRFTISASSSDATELRQSSLRVDYSTSTFLSNQVSNGFLSVVNMPGTVATDYPVYGVDLEDLDNNSFRVLLGDVFGVPGPMDEFATVWIDKIPLVRLEMRLNDCDNNPMLSFQEFDMQGESFYYDEDNFPFFSLAYEPVIAEDEEIVHPCGCSGDPKINSWTPEEIVAGDNQVLTIFGENFGVFQRGADPGDDGTGSSVLFNNGDDHSNNPDFIAAGKADFMIGGILKWTDTEIQVKVPSTDWKVGIHGPASTGRFKVRNGCNEEDIIGLFDNLKIPYALTNFRLENEGAAKRLGLRNNNGLSGGQDGYQFQMSANTDPSMTSWSINIPNAFNNGLTTWCNETEIRFKRKQGFIFTPLSANDGVNQIIVAQLNTPNAEAGLIQGQAYFPIDCNGSDPEDEDGGFIMSDLDFMVDLEFAQTGSQSRAERVFEHEIGHGHNINHARCFGFLCSGPLMEATAASGIKDVDVDGGNSIFDDSQTIINNGCTGSSVAPVAITSGSCGTLVAVDETSSLTPQILPNPTTGWVSIRQGDRILNWRVMNSTGQVLKSGKPSFSDFEVDFSMYPPGTYFLFVEGESEVGHFKIIKL